MITCDLKGGFGNQLFQIFAVITYSLDNKKAFKFIATDNVPSITPRHSYWKSFLRSLKFFTIDKLPHNSINFARVPTNPSFHYEPLPKYENLSHENICLNGYFQSYKYFHHRRDDIFRLIKLSEQKQICCDKYGIKDMDNTISVHFRLGDYKHLSHTHPIMPVSYYVNALTHILSKSTTQKYKIVYFCEKEDNDYVCSNYIDVISSTFPCLTFEKARDDMEDWEQVLLMSCCSHNIIANSSFSWFGAYFNDYNKKTVICYPNVWFAGNAANVNNTCDMFPPSWIKISL